MSSLPPAMPLNPAWAAYRAWLLGRLKTEFAGPRAMEYRSYAANRIEGETVQLVLAGKSDEAKQHVEKLLEGETWWRDLRHPIGDNTKVVMSIKYAQARRKEEEEQQ